MNWPNTKDPKKLIITKPMLEWIEKVNESICMFLNDEKESFHLPSMPRNSY